MAWWKYKPLFEIKWREPYCCTRAFNKTSEKRSRWRTRPFMGIVTASFLMAGWKVATYNPNNNTLSFASALLLAILGGFGIVYFKSLILYFGIREIGFGPKAIASMDGVNTIPWPYEHIQEVRFEDQTFGRKKFQIMIVTMVGKRQLIVAVPNNVDIQKVINFLKNKGIEAIHENDVNIRVAS